MGVTEFQLCFTEATWLFDCLRKILQIFDSIRRRMSGRAISLYGFPSVKLPEDIKEFLEQYTDEGTVYAVEVAQPKNVGSRTHAKVQFTDVKAAEIIKSVASDRLWYGDSYLKAKDLDRDIVPRPRTFLHNVDDVTLHFGCQISKDEFSVLWNQENVSVKFGFGIRKIYFFLSFRGADYKLELSYETIWQVEMRRPRDRAEKFLLIQLFGAPKIYKKDATSLNYFKEAADDQWIRDVDFTSSRIGQSSALCLEIPRGRRLPELEDYFPFYKETGGRFILERGWTSLSNSESDLVPLVQPVAGFDLPYEILFKVNSLVQHGSLPWQKLDAQFFRLVDPRRTNISYIERALEKLFHLKECCYEPAKWLQEQYLNYFASYRPSTPSDVLDDGLVHVHRVQITPTKVYFCGPEVSLSNRVLRNYLDDLNNFLRVSFVDEDLDRIYAADLSPRTASATEQRRTSIYWRILSVLRNGIVIGDKKFEFLGFSQSQLRDNSLWMFASRPGLTAADIRDWMGDFRDIRNVAKYAARLGQSFGSSRETFNVGKEEIEKIPDIEMKRRGVRYVFSDGIGKISAELAHKIARKIGFVSYTPSAFQIRYGGYKGVVAVDPSLTKKLSLRTSMSKYKSNNTSLDVLGWSKYQPCFLNRQVITLLSSLGVKDRVFGRKQKQAVAQLNAILTDPSKAQEALELMAPGENTNTLKEMLACGYRPDAEPFLSMMLQTFRASKLLDLRTKSRIFVSEGRCMMGCLDETGTLEYGQVFVQYSRPGHAQFSPMFDGSESDQNNQIVEGNVVITKNPCLHPGDMRVLEAVNVPALRHMVDCVVFPQKGKRPHPNECSGSDLDGDVYFVCWDRQLIPPRECPPMDYTAAQSKILDHDVTVEEVQEYFADYMVNDSLGIICNAHTVFADKEPFMAMSENCIKLARLSSIAVDFPKTGVAAEVPQHLRVKEYPDFMEKPDKLTYESQRVIGKLFRAVRDIAPDASPISRSFTEQVAYDPDMEVDGYENYVADALHHKNDYDNKLRNLMDYFGIRTEAEVISGWIMKASKSFDKKRDLDTILFAVRSLRKQARAWFNPGDPDDFPDDLYAKASAWYHVTYHPTYWGRCHNEGRNRDHQHFLSFPWCVSDKLIDIKKGKARRASSYMSSLKDDFNYLLSLHSEICV